MVALRARLLAEMKFWRMYFLTVFEHLIGGNVFL